MSNTDFTLACLGDSEPSKHYKLILPILNAGKLSKCLGHLDSRVVFTLEFWTLVCYALGREFEPWWCQTLFRTQAQHLCFIHNSVWFVWFDTIICLSNLSCELWSRKLKIKEIYLKKRKVKSRRRKSCYDNFVFGHKSMQQLQFRES